MGLYISFIAVFGLFFFVTMRFLLLFKVFGFDRRMFSVVFGSGLRLL